MVTRFTSRSSSVTLPCREAAMPARSPLDKTSPRRGASRAGFAYEKAYTRSADQSGEGRGYLTYPPTARTNRVRRRGIRPLASSLSSCAPDRSRLERAPIARGGGTGECDARPARHCLLDCHVRGTVTAQQNCMRARVSECFDVSRVTPGPSPTLRRRVATLQARSSILQLVSRNSDDGIGRVTLPGIYLLALAD
eukprot:1176890-Prorocentrum_minimum.AAC.2